MPEPTKIPRPFADSGDKNSIPDSSGSIGFASWQEGFPAITGTPFAQGGVAPKRADFNGIFNALSAATVWNQQGGVYAYDSTTDYEVGNIIEYSGDLYKCITANGPSSAVKAPTDATVWSKVMTSADTAAAYLPLSGGTLTGTLNVSGTFGRDIKMIVTDVTRGDVSTATSKSGYKYSVRDSNNAIINGLYSKYEVTNSNSYSSRVGIYAFNPATSDNGSDFASIQVGYNENGPYTYSPTPATGDNSAKIATTAFVYNFWASKLDTRHSVDGGLISIPNGVVTNLLSVTLTKGVFLVNVICIFATNASGYRQVGLALSSTSPNSSRYLIDRKPALNGALTNVGFSSILTVSTASVDFYLNAYQTCGSALNVESSGIEYIRLA